MSKDNKKIITNEESDQFGQAIEAKITTLCNKLGLEMVNNIIKSDLSGARDFAKFFPKKNNESNNSNKQEADEQELLAKDLAIIVHGNRSYSYVSSGNRPEVITRDNPIDSWIDSDKNIQKAKRMDIVKFAKEVVTTWVLNQKNIPSPSMTSSSTSQVSQASEYLGKSQ